MKKKTDSQRTFFPWEDVEACRGKGLEKGNSIDGAPAVLGCAADLLPDGPPAAGARGAESCPTCGTLSENLTWIYFVSPPWSWRELCGSAGWITVCDKCHVQVQFFCEAMN